MQGEAKGGARSVGPYQLSRCLSSTEQAEVYLARTYTPDGAAHQVALKVLLTGPGSSEAAFQRLIQTMEPALRCQHPAVVRALELRSVDGVMAIASEYVEGADLGRVMAAAAGAALPPGAALQVARRVLEALHHFHTLTGADGRVLPVVHGNLHPGNVLISSQGAVRVSDFIVSLAASTVGSIQRQRYCSPEQAGGDAVDHRADLFNVGLLLYEGLCGSPAYDPAELEHPDELEAVVREADIEPLDQRVEPFAPGLDTLVMQALDPEPGRRPPSAAAMLEQLLPYLGRPEVAQAEQQLAGLVACVPGVEADLPLPPPVERTKLEPAFLPPPPAPPRPADPQAPPWPAADDPDTRRTTALLETAAPLPAPRSPLRDLSSTRLARLLDRQQQQRTAAGQSAALASTLMWSPEGEGSAFVVDPEADTQRQQAPPVAVARRGRLALALAAAALLGLGGGAAAGLLRSGTATNTAGAPRSLAPGAPLSLGSWRLELLPGGVQRQPGGATGVTLQLHHDGQPWQRTPSLTLVRGHRSVPPILWAQRGGGAVTLLFPAGPGPLVLRFSPPDVAPVDLALPAAKKNPQQPAGTDR